MKPSDGYRCIAPLCEPLFCIGCNCAVPTDVYQVLMAECDAAKQDAARYRWLAGKGWAEAALYAIGPREWGANGVALLNGPQLDNAIDAAMAAGVPVSEEDQR